jgi:hypothetical protein
VYAAFGAVPLPKEIIIVDDASKVARRKYRVFELGISYFGRTYEEGKKIGLRDASQALWCILRYWRWD